MHSAKRHILLISNYIAPDAGAAAVRNTRLANELGKMGHTVTVLTSMPHYPQGRIHDGYGRQLVIVENRDGVRVVQTWLWATPSNKISRKLLSQISFMLTATLRGIFLKRPDVILVEAQPTFSGLAGRMIAFIMRRPYVLNISDLWPEHLLSVGAIQENSMVYRIARAMVNHIYRHAACIVAMSPEWTRRIKKQIAQQPPVKTVLNGVNLNQFQPHLDTAAFRATHDLYAANIILFIGTFATQYNFALMFEAIARFKDRDDVQVAFIGQGSQRDVVASLAQQARFAHVKWIDWLPHHEVPMAWNTAAMTFWAMGDHPLYEGTVPAKLFEAMACGVPMVVYARGVLEELFAGSQAGMLVSSGGAAALGDALEMLLDDTDTRETMARNARTYAEAHFDHTQVADRYASILVEASR